MNGVTYDTGILLAAEARRQDAWALHKRILARGDEPFVPAVVFAQAWRGGPQALLSRLLKGCIIEAFDENRARPVGHACCLSGQSDVVDAAVVTGASERGDLIITSDPDDLRTIAEALDQPARIHVI